MSGLQTDQTSAKCLPNSQETQQFREYINSCRTAKDTTIANTFLSGSIEKYIDLFDSYRAQYTNLMINADSVSALSSNTTTLKSELQSSMKHAEKLKDDIKEYRQKIGSSDKTFLEEIYNGTPTQETAPTLQDIALLLFWFSWLVMTVTLVFVRWTSPGGGWKAGLFALVVLLLVTLCVFGILAQVA